MSRHVHRAEVLSIGTEITVGETRDTNAGELAGDLTDEGVIVGRITAVPDVLESVIDAWRSAIERSDLVVSTGGLGPTPDDLTREALAAVVGEAPDVDPELEAWLRGLWRRRRLPFPEINLKQAWLIPSAIAIPNQNGTAPGWWVDAPGGTVAIALPGPPREMRPMWREFVLPRLRDQGLGIPQAVLTLRTSGIGESQLAAMIGEDLLAATNPSVATYARSDAVDVRIAATALDGRSPEDVLAATVARIREVAGLYIWAEGPQSWAEAIGRSLESRGWSLGISEAGTAGSLAAILADVEAVTIAGSRPVSGDTSAEALADSIAGMAAIDVAVGVAARPAGSDTAVEIAVITPVGRHVETRTAFLAGAQGRHRAGLAAASVLLARLRAGAGQTAD